MIIIRGDLGKAVESRKVDITAKGGLTKDNYFQSPTAQGDPSSTLSLDVDT